MELIQKTMVLHDANGNRQLAYSMSSTGRICKQTMTMNAGYLSSLPGDAAWQYLHIAEVSNRQHKVDTLAVSCSVRDGHPNC